MSDCDFFIKKIAEILHFFFFFFLQKCLITAEKSDLYNILF